MMLDSVGQVESWTLQRTQQLVEVDISRLFARVKRCL
jgi:hypothetical protein